MSLFKNIFGEKKENESFNNSSFWKMINTENDLKEAINQSEKTKIAIFKHSTRCFISKTVLKNFEKEVAQYPNTDTQFYFLDLIQYRELSNKIAEDFNVRHESPQLIVFENRKPINDASHQNISISQVLK